MKNVTSYSLVLTSAILWLLTTMFGKIGSFIVSARKAGNNLDEQNEKIRVLNQELSRKQNRLSELDAMRASISTSQQ